MQSRTRPQMNCRRKNQMVLPVVLLQVVQSKTDFFSGIMLQVTLLLHLLSQAVPQTATVTTFLDGQGWTASAYPVPAPATGCTFMAGFDYKPSKYMKTQSRAKP